MRELAEWLQTTPVSVGIQASKWMVPLLQSIHILTIGVVFVSSLMIALRVLGRMRVDEPFGAVWRRFAPWMWSGLAVMTLTGLLLVLAEPVREVTTLSFWVKMTLVLVAVSSTALFGRALRAAAAGGAGPAQFSAAAKSGALALIIVWLAIIFLGRAIAYDTEVWGSLSRHA
ncbi:MAG TPA: hypothetical protein VG994_04625 [Steroidobacteraceae bacterium]|nr:hypothetical protein [Steroidobacteraceae bacterium]